MNVKSATPEKQQIVHAVLLRDASQRQTGRMLDPGLADLLRRIDAVWVARCGEYTLQGSCKQSFPGTRELKVAKWLSFSPDGRIIFLSDSLWLVRFYSDPLCSHSGTGVAPGIPMWVMHRSNLCRSATNYTLANSAWIAATATTRLSLALALQYHRRRHV